MGRAIIITTGGGTDIEDGSPNATEEWVVSGYTFYALLDDPRIGTMPDHRELEDVVVETGESYDLALGYHGGTMQVVGEPLANKTSASAEDTELLWEFTGWREGNLITGTMENRQGVNGDLLANGEYTVPQGWHDGAGVVTQALATRAATNITPSANQQTVVGESVWTTGAQTVLGNGNLVAGNIKKNVNIFGVTGNYALDTSVGITIFSGYSSGSNEAVPGAAYNPQDSTGTNAGVTRGKFYICKSFTVAEINDYKRAFNSFALTGSLWQFSGPCSMCTSGKAWVALISDAYAQGNSGSRIVGRAICHLSFPGSGWYTEAPHTNTSQYIWNFGTQYARFDDMYIPSKLHLAVFVGQIRYGSNYPYVGSQLRNATLRICKR